MSREAADDILSIVALAHPCASQELRAATCRSTSAAKTRDGRERPGMRPLRIAASRRRRTAAIWHIFKEAAV
jgi:hypothetical protein